MTVIAIQCPACRTTDNVPAPAIVVDADAATGDEGSAATVTWVCGGCAELVSVPVEWAPLLAVVSAGAALLETIETSGVDEGARPRHPESPTGGALFIPDDLLDFHQSLDGEHWLEELCAPAEPQRGAGPA